MYATAVDPLLTLQLLDNSKEPHRLLWQYSATYYEEHVISRSQLEHFQRIKQLFAPLYSNKFCMILENIQGNKLYCCRHIITKNSVPAVMYS
jgi:hypothetical protein